VTALAQPFEQGVGTILAGEVKDSTSQPAAICAIETTRAFVACDDVCVLPRRLFKKPLMANAGAECPAGNRTRTTSDPLRARGRANAPCDDRQW